MDYKRPPITEAVIEVRTRTNLSDKSLSKIAGKLELTYPTRNPLTETNVNVDLTGQNVDLRVANHGWKLASDDQADIVLIKRNGVTLSRLSPYQGWEVLFAHFQEVWPRWKAEAGNNEIDRIGIRYINRIDVPTGDKFQPGLYVTLLPHVPQISTKPIKNFFTQVILPLEGDHWLCTATTAILDPPMLVNHTSVLLDIDVFRTEAIPRSDAELADVISEGRGLKNHIFEACITAASRELFQK